VFGTLSKRDFHFRALHEVEAVLVRH
jgi:hypothetical protein